MVDLIRLLRALSVYFTGPFAGQKLQLFLNCKVGGLGISDCAARKRGTNICIPLQESGASGAKEQEHLSAV